MALEEGAQVSGTVSGITNFGAFIDLGDNKTGLVHISQVSNSFVKDIHDVLAVGDQVTVKVVKIGPDGKIALSMKQAVADPVGAPAHGAHEHSSRPHRDHEGTPHGHAHHAGGRGFGGARRGFSNHHQDGDFNNMLASYLKESETRLSSLKRQADGKRGGRGGRRS